MKRRVLVDLDAIIADFLGGALGAHFVETGVFVRPDAVGQWDYRFDVVNAEPTGRNLYYYFSRPGFFRNLEPIGGAVEGVKRLRNVLDVAIVSSATLDHVPAEKLAWLREHLPWFDVKNVFFAQNKGWFRANAMIDDYPNNVGAFLVENPLSSAYTLRYAYNDDPRYRFRADSWLELADRVLEDLSR